MTSIAPKPTSSDQVASAIPGPRRSHIGRVVAGSLAAGFAAAVILPFLPVGTVDEDFATAMVLIGFALGWALVAVLSTRFTDQPQRWAVVPAIFMVLSGALVLLAPNAMVDALGWVWPAALLVLVVWVWTRARRELHSRTRVWLLCPVLVILVLFALAGGYETIGHATPLPVMIYSRDWAVFTPQMVARLCDRVPTLAAWKDGQGNGRVYQRIMNYNGDRLAWLGGLGDDCVPTYFAAGVQAFTSSISNIAPKLSLELADAGVKRDFARLDPLMKRFVNPLYAIRERARGYEVSAMKDAMEILGMTAGPVRPPLMNTRPADVADIRELMGVYREWIEEGVSEPVAQAVSGS